MNLNQLSRILTYSKKIIIFNKWVLNNLEAFDFQQVFLKFTFEQMRKKNSNQKKNKSIIIETYENFEL